MYLTRSYLIAKVIVNFLVSPMIIVRILTLSKISNSDCKFQKFYQQS